MSSTSETIRCTWRQQYTDSSGVVWLRTKRIDKTVTLSSQSPESREASWMQAYRELQDAMDTWLWKES